MGDRVLKASEWDFEGKTTGVAYPWLLEDTKLDIRERILTDTFKQAVLDGPGQLRFITQRVKGKDPDTGEEVERVVPIKARHAIWTYGGETLDSGMRGRMGNKELLAGERKCSEAGMEGKPSVVLKALWWWWDAKSSDWVQTDRTKTGPVHWLDVTDLYFDVWRVDAYKGKKDPFEGQKRPKTDTQKWLEKESALSMENQLLKQELEAARAKLGAIR